MRRPRLAADPRLLASPVRVEIVGLLQTHGPSSIRELASHLGRPADGLYHHVRLLLKAQLLREEEKRAVGKRQEAVYALEAPRVGGRDSGQPGDRAGLVAAARTALRLADREFAAAIAACPARASLANLRLSRQRVWLSDEALEKARRLIGRLEELLARENRKREGRLHVVTTVLVPLVKRRRF